MQAERSQSPGSGGAGSGTRIKREANRECALREAQSNASSDSKKNGGGGELQKAHARISELETETEELCRQLAEKSMQLADSAEALEHATQKAE